MIKSIILNNALPIILIGYYVSILLSFSRSERMSVDLRPRHQRFYHLILSLSPVAFTISIILSIAIGFARMN